MNIVKRFLVVFIGLLLVGSLAVYLMQWYVDDCAKDYIVSAETAPKADAILVLGALVYSNGQPSGVLAERLDNGYELYKAGKARKIIVSGDNGTVRYDEVNAMKNYLLQKGVLPEDIFMDHAGFNTYDSMYRAKEIFGVKSLLITTQDFHINRSLYIARRLDIDAYGYPSKDDVIYNLQRQNFRELLAKVKAVIDVELLHRKPKFLGEQIDIFGDGRITDDK